jgi:hypothetical protein
MVISTKTRFILLSSILLSSLQSPELMSPLAGRVRLFGKIHGKMLLKMPKKDSKHSKMPIGPFVMFYFIFKYL